MASYTTNLNLKKPAGSENVAIGDINNNMDIIDSAVGALNSKISQSIVSIGNASTGLLSNVTGELSVSGGIVYIYFAGTGMKSAGNNAEICTLIEKYRPKISAGNYVILPLFSEASPYTPVGTVWIYANGEVRKYGTANSGQYACGAYPISY